MQEKEIKEIEELGQIDLDGIRVMTIIGEIEGHQLSSQNAKTTKYEHMIPVLARAEQDISGSWRESFYWSSSGSGGGLFADCKKCNDDDTSGEDIRNFYRSNTKLPQY